MIKINNNQLTEDFIKSVNYLSEKEVSVFVANKLENILTELSKCLNIKNEEEGKLIQKFALKNDKGEIIIAKDEDGNEIPNAYNVDPNMEEEYKKVFKDFLLFEHEIDSDKLQLSEISDIKISTKHFSMLKILFHI